MSARASSLFAAVSILWGIPYLLIKIAVDGGISPVTLSWGRMVLGGAVLLALAARSGSLAQLRGHWRALIAYAIAELAIPLPLIATGERHIASSLAAIVVATVPLLVALLALKMDRTQRVTGRRLAGLCVGLVGVALLVGVNASGSSAALLSVGAVFLAAIGYSVGPLILNRYLGDVDPPGGDRLAHAYADGRRTERPGRPRAALQRAGLRADGAADRSDRGIPRGCDHLRQPRDRADPGRRLPQ
jgi:drug/metabolite transporter (DMT)-like permease